MLRVLFRLYRKSSYLFSKIFGTNYDSEKIENRYFSIIKKFRKSGTSNINNHKIYFNLNSDVTKRLFLDNEFESNEINYCLEYIIDDSVVLDIGANIGLHTVYFAQKAKNGIVFAFEPSKSTFRFLVNNTCGLNNVITLNFAVSDKTHMTKFYVSDDDAYSSLKDTQRKKIAAIENVMVYDLNTFFIPVNIKKLDFVKIDVEGFEFEVLKGMDKLITYYKPTLFVEIYKGTNSNDSPEETIEFIVNKGYDARVIKDGGLEKYERHDDRYHNYFFTPKNPNP